MEVVAMEDLTQSSTGHSLDQDLALVEASIRGDITAFEELVRRYDRKLLRIAYQVTHNTEDAQEAVQEAFLKAYRKLNQFQRKSTFCTWLIRIALNESLMILRRQRRYAQELPFEYEDANGENFHLDVADWSPNPEQLYSRSELQGILRKALEGLSPALRVVFILQDLEGFSIKETAAVLDLNCNAVKARLHRARLQLREKLSKYFRKPIASGENSQRLYGVGVPAQRAGWMALGGREYWSRGRAGRRRSGPSGGAGEPSPPD